MTAFLGFCWKTEKNCLTELHYAPLEGLTIFLERSSPSHSSLNSSRLAELKYAILTGPEVGLKNYGARSYFYRWSKHGLLEGLTFLFQYSFITHTKLESSRLGQLKYAISAGYAIRQKNESFRKGKKMTRRVYMVTVVWAA